MTVAVLAIGLFAAGVGTMAFLRNTLVQNLDSQLQSLAATDVASGLFEVMVADDGTVSFVPKKNQVTPDYFVALYEPGTKGLLVAHSGGAGGPEPVFPAAFLLQDTVFQAGGAFSLDGTMGGSQFRAAVAPQEIQGTSKVFTQLVALPISTIDRVVTTYLGIFGVLALITIVAGALLTRWAVTITFRSLTQVESTAMSIAAGDFSQRMTDIEPGTEVGRLKLAINTMLTRVDGALSQRDASVRQMRRFVGDASHELRTPLVSLRGYAELYRMGAIRGEEDTAQAMERIEKEAIRMGVLVEDLLALARLDERRDVKIVTVDLRPIARDAALDVRAAAPRRRVTVVDTTAAPAPDAPAPPTAPSAPGAPGAPGATTAPAEPEPDGEASRRQAPTTTSAIVRAGASTLSLLRRKPRPVPASQATTAADAGARVPALAPLDLAPAAAAAAVAVPPIVLGEEDRIRQVVANLVANARRYTPDDSPLELVVGVDATAGMGWVAIVDHGEGVPAQIRDQIFQRFWRADNSRARETGGSGLGLSIVASIVDALHGDILVEDTPGGGATFRVSFPLARGRDAAEHLLIETRPLPRLRREP